MEKTRYEHQKPAPLGESVALLDCMQVPVGTNDMLTLPRSLVNCFLLLRTAFYLFLFSDFSDLLPAGTASNAITGCFAA